MPESASLLEDLRNYITPTALILAELYNSKKTTFTELLDHTRLPRRTVALKLKRLKERGWLDQKRDTRHHQRIFYSLTHEARKEMRMYLTKSILALIAGRKNTNAAASIKWSQGKLGAGCKLVIFDLDGVLYDRPWANIGDKYADTIAVSTWDVLFKELGIYDLHEHLKALFASGILDYVQWGEAACKALMKAELNKTTFDRVISNRPLMLGAEETIRVLKQNSIKTCVITGSFEALALRAKNELGVDHYLASCRLLFNSNERLEGWKLQPTDYENKAKFIEEIARANNISLKECAYVGDDVNDIKALGKVGISIAFNAEKEKVRQVADIVVEQKNLKEILPHLRIDKTTELRTN